MRCIIDGRRHFRVLSASAVFSTTTQGALCRNGLGQVYITLRESCIEQQQGLNFREPKCFGFIQVSGSEVLRSRPVGLICGG